MIFDDTFKKEEDVKGPVFVKPSIDSTAMPTTTNAWRNDPRVQAAAERYTYALSKLDNTFDPGSYFDDNRDIVEVLRDEDNRIATIINRAGNLDELSPQAKKDYNFLRSTWQNTNPSNFDEWTDYAADLSTDIFADPLNALGLIFTGGSSNIAAQTAGKEGLKQVLKRAAVSDSTKAQTIRGAIASGAYGTLHEDQLQRAEMATGLSSDYQIARTATVGGVSALAGAALVGSVAGTSKFFKNRAKERMDADEQFRKANSEGPEGIDPNVQQAVDDNIEILKRSSRTDVSADVTPGRASVVIDQEPIQSFSENVSKKAGGGERTTQEVADTVNQVMRDSANKPLDNLGRRVGFEVNRIINRYGAKMFFKPVSVVESFSKFSQTANDLMKKFRYDAGRNVWGDRDYDAQDFFEVYKETAGRYFVRAKVAMEPLALNMRGKLSEVANNNIIKTLRGAEPAGEAVGTIAGELREILDDIAGRLLEEGFIDEAATNYVPRMWSRSAIEKNKETFISKLMDANEVNSVEEGLRVVEEMLDKKNQLDGGSSGGNAFFFKRQFNLIEDNEFEEFLNNDIVDVMNTYIFQSSKQLAKKQVFGVRNLKEYRKRYVDNIRAEMRKAGKTLTVGDEEDLINIWKLTTGEDVSRFESSKVQGFIDAYSVANRLAYLPLATLSSVTEVFINVGKAGVTKTLKGLAKSTDAAQDTIQKQLKEKLGKQGLTENEIWKEMNKFGLALDTAMSDLADRLAGDGLSSELARKVNNNFFRLNFLDQWTKSVQMMSYVTGKTLITDNLRAIAKNKGLPDSRRITRLKDELKELNIDIEGGLNWVETGNKDFEEVIQRGASRYANEVILNPSAESGLKPMWMANPQSSILFQFMGYPAAFTNTVLKNAAKGLLRDPIQNAPRIVPAALIMTEMARWTNYARSGGESERFKDREQIYTDAVVRWGGNGLIADMMGRSRKAMEIYQDPMAGVAGLFGPVGQDLYTLVRRGDIVSFFGKKVPLYGAGRTIERTFDVEFMDEYNKNLKELNEKFEEAVVPERSRKPFMYAAGGVVKNVPNVPEEPDQRIDKITGRPYDKQAGEAFVDNEEDPLARLGLVVGGLAKPVAKVARTVTDEIADLIKSYSSKDADPESIKKAANDIVDLQIGQDDYEIEQIRKSLERTSFTDYDEYVNEPVEEVLDKYRLRETEEESFIQTQGQFRNTDEILLEDDFVPDLDKDVGEAGISLSRIREANDPISQKTSGILNRLIQKMPRVSRSADPVVEADPEVRQANIDRILEESVVKTPVYRATGHGVDTDFDVGFTLANEISPHFGTKGQADDLAIRRYFDYEIGYTEKVPAELLYNAGAKMPGKTPSMIKGYLYIKNPITIESDFGVWKAEEILQDREQVDTLIDSMVKSSNGKLKEKELRAELFDTTSKSLKEYKEVIDSYDTNIPEIELQIRIRRYDVNDKLRAFLKSKGFDGIKYLNKFEDKGAKEFSYIPFEPQQFKAVFAENFDLEDPRVYKAEGGVARADMLRSDGSVKSPRGFLGPVENTVQGGTMTEVSIGTEINGKKMEIPTMVPTLTEDEVKTLSSMKLEGNAKNIPESIIIKAKEHARMRLEQGKSPFYQDGE
jgi:hypothetical protein